MDWDEPTKTSSRGAAIGDNLESLSVAELEARIAMLETEIKRVAAERDRKRQHEEAAWRLFKS